MHRAERTEHIRHTCNAQWACMQLPKSAHSDPGVHAHSHQRCTRNTQRCVHTAPKGSCTTYRWRACLVPQVRMGTGHSHRGPGCGRCALGMLAVHTRHAQCAVGSSTLSARSTTLACVHACAGLHIPWHRRLVLLPQFVIFSFYCLQNPLQSF